MMANIETTFTVTDRWGVEHQYEVQLHNPIEGMRILQQLIGYGITPLVIGFEKTAINLLSARRKKGEAREAALDAAAEGLRLGDAAQQLGTILERMPPTLWADILKYANRDNEPLFRGDRVYDSAGKFVVSTNWQGAYRGNPYEMIKAAWQVCRINGFFPESPIFNAAESGMAGLFQLLNDLSTTLQEEE